MAADRPSRDGSAEDDDDVSEFLTEARRVIVEDRDLLAGSTSRPDTFSGLPQ